MADNSKVTRDRQLAALHHAMGPLVKKALRDPEVVEVMANPDGTLWVDRTGKGMQRIGTLPGAARGALIRHVANALGLTANESAPDISGALPVSGERFQGMLPPIVEAPLFTIRKRPKVVYTLDDYVAKGTLSPQYAKIIRDAIDRELNLFISGPTGSGKTTLANAILAEPGFTKDRVAVLEDTRELQVSSPNFVSLLTKQTPPERSLSDLVKTSLRLNVKRLVVGETRGPECLDMIGALNTGHRGSVTTLHAPSPRRALQRIEQMIGLAAVSIPRHWIAQAVDLVVQMERAPEGRRVTSMCRVGAYSSDTGYEITDL